MRDAWFDTLCESGPQFRYLCKIFSPSLLHANGGEAECKAQCEGRGVYFQLSSYMKRTIDSETNRYLRRLLSFRSNSILATRPRVLFKQLVKQRIVTDVLSIFDRTVEHVQN